jgi:hypothetical protein
MTISLNNNLMTLYFIVPALCNGFHQPIKAIGGYMRLRLNLPTPAGNITPVPSITMKIAGGFSENRGSHLRFDPHFSNKKESRNCS